MWRQSQIRGHNAASLDPLGMFAADLDTSEVPELLLHTHDLGNTQHLCWVSRACNCFAVVAYSHKVRGVFRKFVA